MPPRRAASAGNPLSSDKVDRIEALLTNAYKMSLKELRKKIRPLRKALKDEGYDEALFETWTIHLGRKNPSLELLLASPVFLDQVDAICEIIRGEDGEEEGYDEGDDGEPEGNNTRATQQRIAAPDRQGPRRRQAAPPAVEPSSRRGTQQGISAPEDDTAGDRQDAQGSPGDNILMCDYRQTIRSRRRQVAPLAVEPSARRVYQRRDPAMRGTRQRNSAVPSVGPSIPPGSSGVSELNREKDGGAFASNASTHQDGQEEGNRNKEVEETPRATDPQGTQHGRTEAACVPQVLDSTFDDIGGYEHSGGLSPSHPEGEEVEVQVQELPRESATQDSPKRGAAPSGVEQSALQGAGDNSSNTGAVSSLPERNEERNKNTEVPQVPRVTSPQAGSPQRVQRAQQGHQRQRNAAPRAVNMSSLRVSENDLDKNGGSGGSASSHPDDEERFIGYEQHGFVRKTELTVQNVRFCAASEWMDWKVCCCMILNPEAFTVVKQLLKEEHELRAWAFLWDSEDSLPDTLDWSEVQERETRIEFGEHGMLGFVTHRRGRWARRMYKLSGVHGTLLVHYRVVTPAPASASRIGDAVEKQLVRLNQSMEHVFSSDVTGNEETLQQIRGLTPGGDRRDVN